MATKATQARRFDYGQIGTIEETPQGFLKVPGFATRCGVFPYIDSEGKTRRELRHPDDVLAPESLVTLKNAVVTLEHPPVMVDPENFEQYSVGYTTDRVEVNRDLVEIDIIIAAKDAISAVREDGVRELSAGYLADIEDESGDYNGTPYDCRQKNIRYNHVALVRRGRAGPEVRLRLDSADAVMAEAGKPAEAEFKTVVIGGETITLPKRIGETIQSLLDRYDEMRGRVMKLEEQQMDEKEKKDVDVGQTNVSPKVNEVQAVPDGKSAGKKDAEKPADPEKTDAEVPADKEKKDGEGEMLQNEIKHLKEQLEAAMAKNDEMKAKLDEMAIPSEGKKSEKMDSVRARVKLERRAEKLVDGETVKKFDSMSDDEIMSAVIKARYPKTDISGKGSVYLQTRFDSIVDSVEESSVVRKEMGSALLRDRMDGAVDPSAARRKYIEESRAMYLSPLSSVRK